MRCAVLGDPVAHSLSPVLHRAGYAAVGLDWTYDAHRVAAGGLGEFVSSLDDSWRGLSLTMPLKREGVALASEVSRTARLAGAANTLLLVDGDLHADNTDVPGAVAALRARYDGPVTAGTILGGGATAASVALALCDLGARSLTLLVRSPDRAVETLAAIDRHAGRPSVTVGSLAHDPVVGEVVVSTLPHDAQSADLIDRCSSVPVVFDALYDPWPTPLAVSAGDRVLVTGFDLLLEQAVLQFEAFTGLGAPVDAMRAAGEAALAGG